MRVALVVVWALASGPVVAWLLRVPASPAWVAMLGYHAGCWTVSVLARARLGSRPRLPVLLLHAAGMAVFVVTAVGLLHPWLPALKRAADTWRSWGLRPPVDLALLAYYVIVNPWVEERFWRGAVLERSLRRRLGATGARLLAVLGFLPMHVVVLTRSAGAGPGALLCLAVLVASMLWTFLRERSGSLWTCTISHFGADLGLAMAYALWLRDAG